MSVVLNYNHSNHIEDMYQYIAKNHPQKQKYLEYRKGWNVLDGSLKHVNIEVSSYCNLRCKMCLQSKPNNLKMGYMGNEIFEKVLESLDEMKVSSVRVGGCGEPLMDKDVFNKVKKLNKIESIVDTQINTNGLLLNENKILELLDSGLHMISFSIDAFTNEMYKNIRGDNLDNLKRIIDKFIDLKNKHNKIYPITRVTFVKMTINEHEIDEFINYWKGKVDYVSIQKYVQMHYSQQKDELNSNNKEKKLPKILCEQPFRRISIRHDGQVMPCSGLHMFEKHNGLGNILDVSLEKIWNGDEINYIRKSLSSNNWINIPICNQCIRASYDEK